MGSRAVAGPRATCVRAGERDRQGFHASDTTLCLLACTLVAVVLHLAPTHADAASPKSYVVSTNVRDCTDCSVATRSRPSTIRYAHPGTDPAPISTVIIGTTRLRWHRWGKAVTRSTRRTLTLSGEGMEGPERFRGFMMLDHRVRRPADGCGYSGGGFIYTRATIIVLSGHLSGKRLRIQLPPTGCETS